MLSPKRTKYRKQQKGRIGGVKSNTTQLQFGRYGLKSLTHGRITSQTMEAVRRALTRKFKRSGQIWIRIYPDIPVTSKPSEVRMGKGKGAPSSWICRVKAGQILFEMDGVSLTLARQAALLAFHKLPVRTTFVSDLTQKPSP
jgi:large subunit ribosomal protein L16